ncbi:hypothetical protein ACHAXR_007768 [Thalassiosira sp. AJA248-18]
MASKVLVVGSGVIGLRTALELLRRQIRVSLVSPQHPLHPDATCSMGAGGLWMPFHCDDSRTDRWAFETLSELSRLSSNSFSGGSEAQSKPGHSNASLVEILPAVSFKRNGQSKIPGWALDTRGKSLAFQHVSIEELYARGMCQHFRLPRKDVMEEAEYSHAWLFQTPIVDAPKMLMHMLEEVKSNQYTDHVDVETNKRYSSINEMIEEAKARGCDGLVNCTGMGSKQLCGDTSLVGARGVLLHYDRASCVRREKQEYMTTNVVKDSVILIEEEPFGSETMPCYMIPRGDIIAVGGTYLEGDEESSIRQCERERIMNNAHIMGIDTDKSKAAGEWVGFRPYRPTSRLEVDTEASSMSGGVKVVHSYGYGGSGWTVYVGAAKEAASLLA